MNEKDIVVIGAAVKAIKREGATLKVVWDTPEGEQGLYKDSWILLD